MRKLNRRTFLRSSALAGGSCLAAGCSQAPAAETAAARVRTLPALTTWAPAPTQAAAMEGMATLRGGARLWYWDTGGSGDPVVLVHAASGSGACWEYQQPALAKAGYRVIGYSTRGRHKSGPTNPDSPGIPSVDLHELSEFLGLDRFHLVGTAAGGGTALDYAMSHQGRLLSLVVANSLGGIQDESYRRILQALLPPTFSQLPADFRELGPSYRAAYRPGVERWLAMHEAAGPMGRPAPPANHLTWASLRSLRLPILLLTGDADLYMPPANLREFIRHLPHSEAAIFSEVGHSAYWEQPEVFNEELLGFLRRHRKRTG